MVKIENHAIVGSLSNEAIGIVSDALEGTKLLHDGRPTEYTATHSRRYPTMERAFLHLLNHMNDNVNIRNKYKSLEQWFEESEKENSIA